MIQRATLSSYSDITPLPSQGIFFMWSSVVVTNIVKGKEVGRYLFAIITNLNLAINICAILSGFIGYVAWQKITGQLSHSNLRLRRYLFSEYIRRKETKPTEKTLLKSFLFSSLFFCMEEKRTRLVDSSDIKKLVADTHPPSDQH